MSLEEKIPLKEYIKSIPEVLKITLLPFYFTRKTLRESDYDPSVRRGFLWTMGVIEVSRLAVYGYGLYSLYKHSR